ncbi:GTPase IMAP family member 7-like [Archocentrus centrarchus]|uniref:GTPase IMAP family member 7-like n=1 Tax=Archocentrus centrarchus TaxID=63155 RepID=UPI0011EA0DE9|nr:GTPase IMAP family member 7-like [Archocentrus centrarchus]
MAGTAGAQNYIRVQQMYRVVLLGDTRAGKSSLANTIFGEDVFRADNTGCQAETKSVHGRRITLINTPDLFSPGRSEEELKPEILRCITDFPPGPHAFLIVLKVDKSTEQQQQAVTEKICQYFSEEAFKYAAVVFTQDDQVSEGMRIQDFIDKNKCVSDLVKKCKSRYHTINNYKQCDNISSQSQVAELLNTINQILKENKGRCYTSKMLPQGGTCSNANKMAYLASTRGTAGAAGAERGGVKEAVRWAMQKMINVKTWIKTYSELMVIVFFSLLLTCFFLKVPFFGILLTVILFVSLYNLI